MNNKILNIFYVFVIAYLILMCFLSPEYKVGFIISIIFIIILWVYNYFQSNKIDKFLKIRLNNTCLEIINKQDCVNIQTCDIKYCESIINAHQSTANFIGYGLSLSHKFIIHTTSKIYEFEFPEKIYENWLGVTLYADYDEVFNLIDLNIPNYKCTFIGNINHIKNDIEYYYNHHKRQNFIMRYYLYFLDLPLFKKLKNILIIIMLILFLFVNLFLILSYLIPFLRNHAIFF